MAVTQNQYTGNGSTVLYSFTFPYLATTDVKVKLDGVTQATTAYSLANATTVQMNTAPANGVVVLIFRDTDNDNKKATFYPGSAIKAEDLNDNIDQILYVAQEVDNNAMSTLGDDAMQGDLSLGNNKITNLGNPVSGSDGVNKTTLDATIDTAIESDVLVGTDLSKSASSGQVTISHNVTGANTTINNSAGNVLQDITISAQGHVTSAGSTNLDDRYYTETELNAGQLDNRYFTETELSGGQLNNLYYTETELDGGQLDNRYFTETELNNGQLDNRYFTEAELNNGQLDTRYFRQDSSETITSGATWSGSDNFIATTAAIDARIVDLVDDVGGFVPIANETSFPATNPDVNNGTGTLVSIKTISSARTPSGGSIVITDGAGSGNDVTITGLGTTVLPAGYGVIVETTGTTHTYTFHRLSPDATSVTAVSAIPNEIATVAGISSHVQTVSGINNDVQVVGANSSNVTTVAGSITNVNTAASNLDQIQNFANVYRIVNSDPTTSLNAGDLIFNTSTNKFKVYTGAAWVDAVARQFSDNTKMLFGDSNDLEIFHNSSDSIINDAGTGSLKLQTGGSTKLEVASTGINVTGAIIGTGDLTIDTNTLKVDSSNNRVGVGTTSPSYKLEVSAETGISGDVRFLTGSRHKFVGGGSGNNLELGTYSSSNTSRNIAIVMDSAGNVGIGTTSPSGASGKVLEINGGSGQARIVLKNSTTGSASTDGHQIFSEGTTLGIQNREAGNTTFETNGSERMRIDSSGNVGIGKTSPSDRLDVQTTHSSGGRIATFYNSDSGNNGGLIIQGGGSDGEARLQSAGGSSFLTFYTEGAGSLAERLRIDSSGKVGVGITSLVAKFSVSENANLVEPMRIDDTNNTDGNRHRISFRTGNSEVGKIVADRSSTTYTTSSDYRLKENEVAISDGIERLKNLKPYRFNFKTDKDEEGNVTKTVDGFFAHEVTPVVPEAISGEKDAEEMQGIDQAKLVPLLTSALQEAITKIETLEARVQALENE